jgi:hypothetical protein
VEEDVEEADDELSVVVIEDIEDVVLSGELVVEGPLELPVQPLISTNPEIRKTRIINDTFLMFIPPQPPKEPKGLLIYHNTSSILLQISQNFKMIWSLSRIV